MTVVLELIEFSVGPFGCRSYGKLSSNRWSIMDWNHENYAANANERVRERNFLRKVKVHQGIQDCCSPPSLIMTTFEARSSFVTNRNSSESSGLDR